MSRVQGRERVESGGMRLCGERSIAGSSLNQWANRVQGNLIIHPALGRRAWPYYLNNGTAASRHHHRACMHPVLPIANSACIWARQRNGRNIRASSAELQAAHAAYW